MTRSIGGLIISAAFLVAPSAQAQTARDSAELPKIVITATKAPVSQTQLSVPVTIITGAELRAKGITQVADALRQVTSAAIVANGSYGSITSIFLRGGESRYTKILVDGVPLNAPGGYIDLSNLTTDNVDRIEIVRGASSVVHGADAVSGVIQIFTRTGAGSPRISASARAGTYDSRDADASVAGQKQLITYSLGGAAHSTAGIHSFNSDYKNGALNGSVALPIFGVADVRLISRYSTGEFHYPTDYTGQPVDTNSYRVQHRLTVSMLANRDITPSVKASVTAGATDLHDLTEDISTPFGSTSRVHSAFRSNGVRRMIDGRVISSLPNGLTLTLGSEYERTREASANLSGPVGTMGSEVSAFGAKRSNSALYTELLGSPVPKFAFNASARADHNSDYGNFVTYAGGVNLSAIRDTRIKASVGTAFNAPAFAQLRPTLYTVGSPNLQPEQSLSWQAGVDQSLWSNAVQISGTIFRQRFTRMIQYVSGGPPTYKGSYANLSAATANGAELEFEAYPGRFTGALTPIRIRANYSEVRPRVLRTDSGYGGSLKPGDALIRRPTHSGSASVGYSASRWNIDATEMFVGLRPDVDFSQFPSPTVTLPSYTRTDLSGNVSLGQISVTGNWEATFRAENLFARKYQEVLGFDSPGRAVLVGLKWTSK